MKRERKKEKKDRKKIEMEGLIKPKESKEIKEKNKIEKK
jgi:hypothetical protein